MNWENILKIKNRRWHSPLDKIMSDGEERTAGQALGLLIDYYENKTRKNSMTGIPPTNAVASYFKMSKKYTSDNSGKLVTYTMNTISKMKDSSGNNLIVKDVENFTQRLRAAIRAASTPTYGKISQAKREGDARISNVNIRETWESDTMLRIMISYRNTNSQERERFDILLVEDESGDFYFLSAEGPGLTLNNNSVVSSETRLITLISEAATAKADFKPIPTKSIRDTSDDEDRISFEEERRAVETANPGYLMIDGNMYSKTELMARAKRQGMTFEQLLRSMGREE